MALSGIVQSTIEAELEFNEPYAALNAAEKLQCSNTAIQAIGNMSVDAGEPDYLMDNLESAVPIVIGAGSQAGIRLGVNSATGAVITFDSPFSTSIIATGDYVPQARGFGPGGEDVHVTIVMLPGSVTFYPDLDNTNIFFTVFPLA